MTTIDELTEIMTVLRARRQCRQCRQWYTEMDSLGRHACLRHPGYLQTVSEEYDGRLNTYSCCGASPFGWHDAYRGPEASLGCLPCDHNDEPGFPDEIVMPIERADILFGERIMGRDARLNETRSHVIIRREGQRV